MSLSGVCINACRNGNEQWWVCGYQCCGGWRTKSTGRGEGRGHAPNLSQQQTSPGRIPYLSSKHTHIHTRKCQQPTKTHNIQSTNNTSRWMAQLIFVECCFSGTAASYGTQLLFNSIRWKGSCPIQKIITVGWIVGVVVRGQEKKKLNPEPHRSLITAPWHSFPLLILKKNTILFRTCTTQDERQKNNKWWFTHKWTLSLIPLVMHLPL